MFHEFLLYCCHQNHFNKKEKHYCLPNYFDLDVEQCTWFQGTLMLMSLRSSVKGFAIDLNYHHCQVMPLKMKGINIVLL
jgi:hypothetical protein